MSLQLTSEQIGVSEYNKLRQLQQAGVDLYDRKCVVDAARERGWTRLANQANSLKDHYWNSLVTQVTGAPP